MKKLICLLLSVFVLMTTIVMPVYAEEIKIDSSVLGGSVSGLIDLKSGTLTFTGKGYFKVPDESVWQGYEKMVTKVVFEEGITMITDTALMGLYNIETVQLPTTLARILPNAFSYAEGLMYVLYNGTEDEWGKVNVTEDGNKSLLNAKFTYEAGGEGEEQEKVIDYFYDNITNSTYTVTQNDASTSFPTKINALYNGSNLISLPITYLNQPDLSVLGKQTINVVAEIPEGYTLADGLSNQFSFTVVVNAPNPSGRCGDSARWELFSWGELTIYGDSSGVELADFDNTTDNKTPWYEHNEDITSATIGYGITKLGDDLFSDTNVGYVYVPKTVTDLNAKAFRNATKLSTVDIGSSDVYYDNGSFIYTVDRSTVVLYDNKAYTGTAVVEMATKIGEYAFANCALEAVGIYPDVTEIADNAFEGCDDIIIRAVGGSYAHKYAVEKGFDFELVDTIITSVTAPEISVPLYSELKLPETVVGVTNYGTQIDIPVTYGELPSVEKTGTFTVQGTLVVPEGCKLNSGLNTTVSINVTVTPAGGVFNNTVKWEYNGDGTLTLGGNGEVSYEGTAPWAEYADEITKVSVLAGITYIAANAFDGLAVTEYTVDAYNDYYYSQDGVLYTFDLLSLVRYPSHKEAEEYVVPDTVTAILEHAFYGCVNLKKVALGENIASMNDTGLENSNITLVVFYDSYAYQYAQDNGIVCETKTSIVESDVYNGVTYTLYSDGYLYLEYDGNTVTSHLPIDLEAVKVLECAEGMTGLAWQLLKRMTNLETVKLPSTFTKTDFLDDVTWVSEVIIADGNESLCVADGAVYSITPNGLNMLYYLYSEEKVFTMTAENVFGIEYGAFDNAEHLEKIILNGDIAYIDSVFEGCDNLKEFYIEPVEGNCFGTENGVLYNLTYDEKSMLVRMPQNSSITDFTIPDTVTRLEDYAFKDCKNLVNVTMGDNVVNKRNVGDGCYALFENAVNLESVVLSDNYEEIHNDTFKGCVKLKSFNFPENLRFIGYSAFEGCASLTGTLEIPSTVTNTDDSVFKGTGYSEVIIPSSLTCIEADMFADCVNLEKVTLAEGVEDISSRVFSGCSKLKEINFPNSIDSIGGSAFYNCTSLEKAVVDNATVYGSAFSGCAALTDFSLNSGKIRSSAFSGCTSLANVTLGDTVTEIGEGAFYNCAALTEFTIPKGVTKINKNIFGGCVNLKKLIVEAENATFYDNAFKGFDFIEEIVLPENISLIGNYVFSGTSITEIEIPAGLAKMNTGNFANCTKLVTAKWSSDFSYIPRETFSGCTALKELYLSNIVTTVYNNAFAGCTALEKVYFSGTKDEWSKIIVEYGNDALLKADVICNDGALTQPSLGANFYENWDGSVEATVYIPEDIVEDEAKLVLYYTNENGELESLSYDITSEDEACYGIYIDDPAVETIKVYLWEDFNNIRPLAEPKTLAVRGQ